MNIGTVKEIKNNEFRVGLTPAGCHALCTAGHKVLVEKGQSVTKGTPLIVTEAMKMETTLSAPISGIVSAIHVAAGERVESGDCLLEIKTQM